MRRHVGSHALSPSPPHVKLKGDVKEPTHWLQRAWSIVFRAVVLATIINLWVALMLGNELTTCPCKNPCAPSMTRAYDFYHNRTTFSNIYSTGQRDSSITRAYLACKSAILLAIYTRVTRAKRACKKIHESGAANLHANFPCLRVKFTRRGSCKVGPCIYRCTLSTRID